MNEPPLPDFSIPSIEEDWEDLYEGAPCGYLTTTVDNRIVRANRTFANWLGYSQNELTNGKRLLDLVTVGARIFFETHFNLLLRLQAEVNEIALDLIGKDGRVLPTLINARQTRDAAGEPIANRLTVFNASERRQYERDLLVARDLFQTTLSCIGDAVVATDAKGLVTFMNPVAEEISGWKTDDAKGRPIA